MFFCHEVKFVVSSVVIADFLFFNICIGHLHVMQGHCQELPRQILSRTIQRSLGLTFLCW